MIYFYDTHYCIKIFNNIIIRRTVVHYSIIYKQNQPIAFDQLILIICYSYSFKYQNYRAALSTESHGALSQHTLRVRYCGIVERNTRFSDDLNGVIRRELGRYGYSPTLRAIVVNCTTEHTATI